MATKKNSPAADSLNKIYPDYPDYPTYPPSEDIYYKATETDLDPEDLTQEKDKDLDTENWNEKNFNQDHSGADLDVPGSELDDAQEEIGSEDEENNNYSIGGDNHNDLEEDNGD
jgi:hypothetical protein